MLVFLSVQFSCLAQAQSQRDRMMGFLKQGMEDGARAAEQELQRQHEDSTQAKAQEFREGSQYGVLWWVSEETSTCAPSPYGMTFSQFTDKLRKQKLDFIIRKPSTDTFMVVVNKTDTWQLWSKTYEDCYSTLKTVIKRIDDASKTEK